jgi:hypothetical protein
MRLERPGFCFEKSFPTVPLLDNDFLFDKGYGQDMPTYEVNITAVSDRAWFDLRKALQMVAGLGWLDARRLSRYVLAVDRNTEQYIHLPCVLVAGIDRARADHVAGLLRQAGATVSVEESIWEVVVFALTAIITTALFWSGLWRDKRRNETSGPGS